MFLDAQALASEGLGTAFAFFLLFLLFVRIATIATERVPRLFFFGAAWLTMTLLAGRRVVIAGEGGGADAWGYKDHFLSPQGAAGIPLTATGSRSANEPLHLGLMRLVRVFTSDDQVYFLVLHGIIMLGVVYFISKVWTRDLPVLPLLLYFPAYLSSLSAIRNWIAIAMLLVALTFYMKRSVKGYYVWAMVAMGFHYSAVVFLALPIIMWLIERRPTIARAVVVLLVMNGAIYVSGGIMTGLLAGGRYEQYLSWEEASFFFVAPMLAIAVLGISIALRSEAVPPESRRLVSSMIFAAGLTTLIMFYGGFRYLSYSILPQAAVAAIVLYAARNRGRANLLAQIGVPIAVYAMLFVEASGLLRSVISTSQVFPLTWH